MTGTLYIVATPIGNLGDITFRAVDVIKDADLILCEDTRVTKKLLNSYGIKTKSLSYHHHSSMKKVEQIATLLKDGENIAYVTDAGTPGISDPGGMLVTLLKEKIPELKIEPVPGPSALTAALSVSGLNADSFIFLGFLPHKKGRLTKFKELEASRTTAVFFESPHRLLKALYSLTKLIGTDRRVVVAKELTKIHEKVVGGNIEDLYNYFIDNQDKIRGEFVILVEGKH